jgi:hypothetical protein
MLRAPPRRATKLDRRLIPKGRFLILRPLFFLLLASGIAIGASGMGSPVFCGQALAQTPVPPADVGRASPAAPDDGTAKGNANTGGPADAGKASPAADSSLGKPVADPSGVSEGNDLSKPSPLKHRKKQTAGEAAKTMPQYNKVTVKLTYNNKVLVPRGADVKITIQDVGAAFETQTQKTKTDAPPYTVVLKIPLDAKLPLKASAVLTSAIGHQFSAGFEIKQENLTNSSPIAVTLNQQ